MRRAIQLKQDKELELLKQKKQATSLFLAASKGELEELSKEKELLANDIRSNKKEIDELNIERVKVADDVDKYISDSNYFYGRLRKYKKEAAAKEEYIKSLDNYAVRIQSDKEKELAESIGLLDEMNKEKKLN